MASAAGDRLVAGLVALALARSLGCGVTQPTPTDGEASELAAVLADVGPQVVLPALAAAREGASALAEACAAWDGASDPAQARLEAQSAWRDAMAAWQAVEALQIGPAASSLTAVAGEDLRDAIYSWPAVNPCRVDQVTVAGGWDAPDFFEVNLVNVYGLDALEHLLFAGPDNVCAPQLDINADGHWDALGAEGVDAARASYARAVAARLAEDVAALESRWSPGAGDFSGQLAGAAGSPYASDVEGLNAVLDALFYLEGWVKERKLARPLGLGDCSGDDCVEGVESRLAGESHRWIRINLASAAALFRGGEGTGFDDLLDAQGHGALADRVEAAFDAAAAAADALTVPVDVAAVEDPDQAAAVYEAVDAIVDLLEVEVAAVLVLQVPTEAAGDND